MDVKPGVGDAVSVAVIRTNWRNGVTTNTVAAVPMRVISVVLGGASALCKLEKHHRGDELDAEGEYPIHADGEGIAWCKGHDGPQVDAFKAACAL